ncbi:MAG: tryptophan-rich sensory protein [Chromatiales bacterium]|jgi:tryptophan-rich sensory protein
MTRRQQFTGLIGWFIVSFAVGAIASIEARSFYAGLEQPDWAPPGWLFGPVWTLLFALMAIAAWLVWRNGGFRTNRIALSLFLTQLAFNALWSWLFFAWRLGGPAFADILLLWVLILATLVAFWRAERLAGILLLPYLLWVSFAAFLNYAVWQLNPALLG